MGKPKGERNQTSLLDQHAANLDLAHLRENLRLTPTERVRKLQAAADFQYEVKVAAETAGLRKAR